MKYPNSSKDYVKPLISASNRGMSLEDDINRTNRYYLTEDTAVIHKKPTPITIVKVDYPKRSAAKILKQRNASHALHFRFHRSTSIRSNIWKPWENTGLSPLS